MGTHAKTTSTGGVKSESLQKVSREHFIGSGPGGTVIVAGGKYTTHRTMAKEIIDYTLKSWKKEAPLRQFSPPPKHLGRSTTKIPVNPKATPQAIQECRDLAAKRGLSVPEELMSRYGGEALEVMDLLQGRGSQVENLAGFPLLENQLRINMRYAMVMHLDDFYFRRTALFLAREDHGMGCAEMLSRVWADEKGLNQAEADRELSRLKAAVELADRWKTRFKSIPATSVAPKAFY